VVVHDDLKSLNDDCLRDYDLVFKLSGINSDIKPICRNNTEYKSSFSIVQRKMTMEKLSVFYNMKIEGINNLINVGKLLSLKQRLDLDFRANDQEVN
jgi:hypothetical protein